MNKQPEPDADIDIDEWRADLAQAVSERVGPIDVAEALRKVKERFDLPGTTDDLVNGEISQNPMRSHHGGEHLHIDTWRAGKFAVVRLSGDLDTFTGPELREHLAALVRKGCYRLILDLESLDFLDSGGLGIFVGGLKRARAHEGSLRLVCTHERILKIFRVTGLTKVFAIHDSVDEAIAADAPGSQPHDEQRRSVEESSSPG